MSFVKPWSVLWRSLFYGLSIPYIFFNFNARHHDFSWLGSFDSHINKIVSFDGVQLHGKHALVIIGTSDKRFLELEKCFLFDLKKAGYSENEITVIAPDGRIQPLRSNFFNAISELAGKVKGKQLTLFLASHGDRVETKFGSQIISTQLFQLGGDSFLKTDGYISKEELANSILKLNPSNVLAVTSFCLDGSFAKQLSSLQIPVVAVSSAREGKDEWSYSGYEMFASGFTKSLAQGHSVVQAMQAGVESDEFSKQNQLLTPRWIYTLVNTPQLYSNHEIEPWEGL